MRRWLSCLTLALVASMNNVATADGWPDLPRGITSFGGAVVDDWLYVYGGHYGQAHHYSRDGQSGEFLRVNLRDPQGWEELPGGPRLTGLALVAHQGQLYRVGGFTAKNEADEEQSLWSQDDFARFDPQRGQWEALPPLPEGRSSHDAAVVGDVLYVVGGWQLQGDGPTEWHETAWSVDLTAKELQWKPIPAPPFHRRAVALAAWQDRLYVIGGMEQEGGATTAAARFDPATGQWSEVPSLIGDGMQGFGSSAFACADRLYATTMSGSLQRLQEDGSAWEKVGQLEQPRFFHRLLAWRSEELVIVGGAHMEIGKIKSLERIPVGR